MFRFYEIPEYFCFALSLVGMVFSFVGHTQGTPALKPNFETDLLQKWNLYPVHEGKLEREIMLMIDPEFLKGATV